MLQYLYCLDAGMNSITVVVCEPTNYKVQRVTNNDAYCKQQSSFVINEQGMSAENAIGYQALCVIRLHLQTQAAVISLHR